MSSDLNPADCLNNLGEQLQEIEILESMYPGAGEFELSDPAVIHDIKQFIEGRVDVPNSIELTIKLQVDDIIVETIFNLPREYPSSALPEVYIRSQNFSRGGQTKINEGIRSFLKDDLILGEPCLISVISWVQDHADEFISRETQPLQPTKEETGTGRFSRYWIYSHHIYSKIKRKDILDMSREYDVTGFCLPGKPGIICIEGDSKNCSDWWSVVRNWNWKRLSLKIQEEEDGAADDKRKFFGFSEIGEVKGASRDYHMDMGQFQIFLEQHSCAHIFAQLFGIEK